MNVKDKNSSWMLPSNRILSVANKTNTDKGLIRQRAYIILFFSEKQNHLTIIRRSDGIFRSIYFSRSNENGPLIEIITNDLANNILHRKRYLFRKQFTGHLRPSAVSND